MSSKRKQAKRREKALAKAAKQGKRRTDNKVFKELAAKNVRKSAKDYLIYFFTIAFGVCLFYTFNSISTQFAMLQVDDRLNFLTFTSGMMAAISILVCAIVGFLIAYANKFLLKRRKKEIGVYITLGMEQQDIAALLQRETVIIGIFSLITGIAAGIFASQGLSMITAGIIGVSLKNFHFMISATAILGSILFFAIIFFFVHRFNVREIKKMKLIDLLYADRKNEVVKGSAAADGIRFLCAILLIGAGYGLIISNLDRFPNAAFVIGLAAMAAGTFFFFSSAVNAVLKVLEKKKAFYYRGLNMFAVKQLAGKVKSNSTSISVITILLFLSIISMSFGLGGGKSLKMGETTPFDATLTQYAEKGEAAGNFDSQTINSQIDLKGLAKEYNEFMIYETDTVGREGFFDKTVPGYEEAQDYLYRKNMPIMGADDYNRMAKQQGKSKISLGQNEFAITYDIENLSKFYSHYERNQKKPILVAGQKLSMMAGGLQICSYKTDNGKTNAGTIIVPQYLAEKLKPTEKILNIVFRDDSKETYEQYLGAVSSLPPSISERNKQDVIVQMASDYMTISYIGIYLGIGLLITAGAVLALQQLSQSADNEKRYLLLSKLGAREEDMKKSVLSQVLTYFGLPLILASIHSAVVLKALFSQMPELSLAEAFQSVGFAAGLVAVVYGIYFVTTYTASRRMAGIS